MMDRTLLKRIKEEEEQQPILPNEQCAFKGGHSTEYNDDKQKTGGQPS